MHRGELPRCLQLRGQAQRAPRLPTLLPSLGVGPNPSSFVVSSPFEPYYLAIPAEGTNEALEVIGAVNPRSTSQQPRGPKWSVRREVLTLIATLSVEDVVCMDSFPILDDYRP